VIKNLVTSGCSFTMGDQSWTTVIQNELNIPRLFNLGSSGAGNRYIVNSVIDTIQYNQLLPQDTFVLVMFSGPARFDEIVSGEYWYLLSDYHWKTKLHTGEDGYWIHSGGRGNSWQDHNETVKLFIQKYVVSDPLTICKETLVAILALENFLQSRGFEYRFMSYVNYWTSDKESVAQGDFSLTHFCSHLPAYQEINFDKWIFSNDKKDCLYEFCFANHYLKEDNFHPTSFGHQEFAKNVILTQIDYLRNKT